VFLSKVSSASARIFSRKREIAEPESPITDLRELARRTVPRDAVDFHTVIAVEGLDALDARLMDISPYGFQCRATCGVLERGNRVWLLLPILGERKAEVMWGLKGLFGCKFMEPVETDTYGDLLPQLQGSHPSMSERA
jgi:hypothetical protein